MEEDDDTETQRLLVREEAIRQILTLCAEFHVDVPEELKVELLGGAPNFHDVSPRSNQSVMSTLIEQRASELAQLDDDKLIKEIREVWRGLKASPPHIDLRVRAGSYRVTNYVDVMEEALAASKSGNNDNVRKKNKQKIQTVASASPLGKIVDRLIYFLKTGDPIAKRRAEETIALDGVNLKFESGKMYLVLGAPKSGKSTLLKMIANTLVKSKDHVAGGEVTINGAAPGRGIVWSNLTAYIDQIDRLHPYLTVKETCEFAFNCRSGGSHWRPNYGDDDEVKKLVAKLDEDLWLVHTIMEGMGLMHVKDTFIGDQQNVRGVSGGEKKRVTVAEMLVVRTPVVCCDEISTGLDAATTYDIVKLFGAAGRLTGSVRIVSLLQPPPETFALFDELILLHAGRVIYSGEVDDVVSHFESLGYQLPDRMDVADWLLAIPTKDGAQFLVNDVEVGNEPLKRKHLTADDWQNSFVESRHGKAKLQELIDAQDTELIDVFHDALAIKFTNSWLTSAKLLVSRELLLWWRDKYQIKARLMQDVIMGIVSGTVFWQASDDAQSVMGILFQSMFFVSLGAMLKVPSQFDVRSIFYKHQDANFFPTWAYVLGRAVAGIPTSIIDSVVYGTIIYWFVGLAFNNGASIANYFVFLLLILVASMSAGLIFSIISAAVKDKTTGQAFMSVSIVFLVLFSGFTVQPDVIPNYWIWMYWLNMFAWILRGLAVNEFDSGKYDAKGKTGGTKGEEYLTLFGFTLNDKPFTFDWVWWGILVSIGLSLFSLMASVFFLSRWRFEAGKPLALGDFGEEDEDVDEDDVQVNIPFQKANLTFKNIHYTVKASTSDEKLELLKGIDGFIEGGKMTALMGSSGAGKTTLMDVLALRKTSGEIVGEIRLNGHHIEPKPFRRCTGYVEQFDVQSPQLTIRETVIFSARLRLEESDPAVTPESTNLFIDQTLHMLELTAIEDLQVGDDQSGGLSFEQRKRLSIAVELVSNPSILFLDEPTSGLDARSAAIVMRGLKKIALTGRAVCATIHQPSNAIFHSFDSLLLLKRGGEVVFFGELGTDSYNLISYLERYPSSPRIQPGENPATWMLTTIGAGSSSSIRKFDYAQGYEASLLHKECLARIDAICAEQTDANKISFPHKYATSDQTQRIVVLKKIMRVYWRSPSYNTTRLMVSAVVALLFGSVYVSQQDPTNESDLNSRVTSIFISTIFLAVNAFNSVLSVFEVERNMFYRHKAALMYNQKALVLALTVAEIPFILLSSMVFVAVFYFMVGFSADAGKFFLYYLFFTLNIGAFTFLGQMMVALYRDSVTAQGFGGLIISFTSLFSGVLIRPNNIPNFWIFAYWLFPGHYALEGLLMSQFRGDHTQILASPGSKFYASRNCVADVPCYGTAEDWIQVTFGGKFEYDHIKWNILYMVLLVVGARVITYIALTRLNYAVH